MTNTRSTSWSSPRAQVNPSSAGFEHSPMAETATVGNHVLLSELPVGFDRTETCAQCGRNDLNRHGGFSAGRPPPRCVYYEQNATNKTEYSHSRAGDNDMLSMPSGKG